MNKVYIVRWGTGYEQPESYIFGLYPTQELADARIAAMTSEDEGWDPRQIWTDVIEVGTNGADCYLSNR